MQDYITTAEHKGKLIIRDNLNIRNSIKASTGVTFVEDNYKDIGKAYSSRSINNSKLCS